MDKEFLKQIDRVKELYSETTIEKLDDEVLICECFCVNARDIREACDHLKKVDLALLQETLNFGHGCQSCLKNSEIWKDNIF